MEFVPKVMEIITEEQAKQMNCLVLAFVGDSVQTLYVRTKLAVQHSSKAGKLHLFASKEICASSQAQRAELLLEKFTDTEKDIYLRARNSKTKSVAKNADIIDYHKASGLEAVFGYLYLTGNSERLGYLLSYSGGEI